MAPVAAATFATAVAVSAGFSEASAAAFEEFAVVFADVAALEFAVSEVGWVC